MRMFMGMVFRAMALRVYLWIHTVRMFLQAYVIPIGIRSCNATTPSSDIKTSYVNTPTLTNSKITNWCQYSQKPVFQDPFSKALLQIPTFPLQACVVSVLFYPLMQCNAATPSFGHYDLVELSLRQAAWYSAIKSLYLPLCWMIFWNREQGSGFKVRILLHSSAESGAR